MKQLIFNSKLFDDQTFTTFEIGRNLWVKIFLDPLWGSKYHLIYYYGVANVGKTHLLMAVHDFLKKMGKKVILLKNVEEIDRTILNFNENSYFLLDNFCLSPNEEVTFFNFLRNILENGGHLVVASQYSPCKVCLPDLRSRLMSELVFELLSLNEQERIACLLKWLAAKNLDITPAVLNYLLNHINREVNFLFKVIDILDEQSQVYGKELTVPFVKKILDGDLFNQ